MEAAPASGGPDGLLAVALGTAELGDELLAGLGPLERGLGGGVEQPGLITAGVGSDGLTGGDQGVHHGLVPHLGAGHVAEGLQRFGEDGLDARRIDLIPLGGLLLETIQPRCSTGGRHCRRSGP